MIAVNFLLVTQIKIKLHLLCIVLPQMGGCIKYFENGGKNMSFKIEDKSIY